MVVLQAVFRYLMYVVLEVVVAAAEELWTLDANRREARRRDVRSCKQFENRLIDLVSIFLSMRIEGVLRVSLYLIGKKRSFKWIVWCILLVDLTALYKRENEEKHIRKERL